MSYRKDYPFVNVFGIRYVLKFDIFEGGDNYDLPIINVELICEDELEQANDIDVLITVNRHIKEYLEAFENVVLYYYCDTAPIVKSNKNSHLSNQEYRQILFDRMFDYARFEHVIKKSIVVEDPEQSKHFINLIAHTNQAQVVDKIAVDVEQLNKS